MKPTPKIIKVVNFWGRIPHKTQGLGGGVKEVVVHAAEPPTNFKWGRF